MDTKICSRCKIEKSIEWFALDSGRKSGYNNRCKVCQRELSNNHYKLNKQNYLSRQEKTRQNTLYKINELKTCCSECGEKRTHVLDFHHKDSKDKDYTIASITNCSWDRIEKELEKCIILCANCHREKHFYENLESYHGRYSLLE